MSTVDILDAEGSSTGNVGLPAEVFEVQVNVPVMHRAVRAQRAAARSGTHDTRTRGEVRGGGKKPWRQKGTGRARQGSIRSPQWVGGGVVFGPHPRDYTLRVNKKERRLALRSALSARHAEGAVLVLDELAFDAPKTAQAVALLRALKLDGRKVLVAVEGTEEAALKSFRNLPLVHVLLTGQLNTYDVLYADALVFTRASLDAFLGHAGTDDVAESTATGTDDVAESTATGTDDEEVSS